MNINRRQALQTLGAGMGAIGLAATAGAENRLPFGAHFAPRAKRVIHLFMNGGPFGPDFLDPKPALKKYAGQRPKGADLRTERPTGGLLDVPFKYQKHGQSGLEMSDAIPMLSRHADDICVLRSMTRTIPIMVRRCC